MIEKTSVNQSYRTILVLLIIILLSYEIYGFLFISWTYWNVIPLTLQAVVLYCLFSLNRYLKVVIKIWSGIIIAGCSLQILGAFLRIFGGDFKNINLAEQFQNIVLLIVFLGLYKGSNKYVIEEEQEIEAVE